MVIVMVAHYIDGSYPAAIPVRCIPIVQPLMTTLESSRDLILLLEFKHSIMGTQSREGY
jgi:hypothetical protein